MRRAYKIYTYTEEMGIIGGYQVSYRPSAPWDRVTIVRGGSGTRFATREDALPIMAQARAGYPDKQFTIQREVILDADLTAHYDPDEEAEAEQAAIIDREAVI